MNAPHGCLATAPFALVCRDASSAGNPISAPPPKTRATRRSGRLRASRPRGDSSTWRRRCRTRHCCVARVRIHP